MEGYIPLANLTFIFIQVLIVGRSSVLAFGKNSTCSDGLGLNYTLPMFEVCRERPDENGKMMATTPKIIQRRVSCPNSGMARISRHRQCRFPDCLRNPCKNGWCEETMVGFKCHCSEGYTGNSCEKLEKAAIISRNQTQHTTSTITTTQQSTTTPDFNECASNPCRNGGTCTDDDNRYLCQCMAGWAGVNCLINLNECLSQPCLHDGICLDGINSYTCQCGDGWTGTNCGIDIDECADEPCENGGVCVDGLNSYTCTCTEGWEGSTCGVNFNECASNPCRNGGTCTDDDNRYLCQCMTGWAGVNCLINLNECLSQPCLHDGICLDGINSYTCQCGDGWTGTNCGIGKSYFKFL
ncbi:fibropellin-3-like [Strongylocentrotus purpuratus]|uniref:EGF-like domain-containing protein n=1 Tax=Strongylocentrotus purpuratus TaxID=7668 RepID=A0A7M7SWX6_STRPU|nr:fibropellin-3-like [Strongylocentrotus purpuratus]